MFLAKDVERITGVKRTRLQQWMEYGFLQPSIPADGHGTRNIWSTDDLIRVMLFKDLTESGLHREMVGNILNAIPPSSTINGDNISVMRFIRIGQSVGVEVFTAEQWKKDLGFKETEAKWLIFDSIIVVNVKKIRDKVTENI